MVTENLGTRCCQVQEHSDASASLRLCSTGHVDGQGGALVVALLAHPRSHRVHCYGNHWWRYRLVVFPNFSRLFWKVGTGLCEGVYTVLPRAHHLSGKLRSQMQAILFEHHSHPRYAFVWNLPSTLVVATFEATWTL